MSPLSAAPTPLTLLAFVCLPLPLLLKASLLPAYRRVVGAVRGALLYLRTSSIMPPLAVVPGDHRSGCMGATTLLLSMPFLRTLASWQSI
eukprot:7478988-Prorocentrum_lima.AAC.1